MFLNMLIFYREGYILRFIKCNKITSITPYKDIFKDCCIIRNL